LANASGENTPVRLILFSTISFENKNIRFIRAEKAISDLVE